MSLFHHTGFQAVKRFAGGGENKKYALQLQKNKKNHSALETKRNLKNYEKKHLYCGWENV